jgi:hypothetical protein
MTADERLARVQVKIDIADKHIAALDLTIREFLNKNPYKVGVRREPETRRLIYYVTEATPTPKELPAITGDIIQNLRSALDHLAYQLFLVGTGGNSGTGTHVYFPIADSHAKYKGDLARKVNGMQKAAIDAISAFEPYKSGKGHDLWTIHALNNIDKHRLLFTVGGAFLSVDLGPVVSAMFKKSFADKFSNIELPELFMKPADVLCPLTVGAELYIDAPDAEVNEKIKFIFNVALNEPGIIEATPLPESLQKLSGAVRDVVGQFKSHLT